MMNLRHRKCGKMDICMSILVFCLLLIIVNCNISLNSAPIQTTNEIVSPTPPLQTEEIININNTIEKDFVLLVTEKDSPIKILDAAAINEKLDFKNGMRIEIKNVSSKSIGSVELGLAPPIGCINYYNVGDLIINSNESDKSKSEILPSEIISLNISPDVAQRFSIKNYLKKCPPEHRKPVIYVWAVHFLDNTTWEAAIWQNKDN